MKITILIIVLIICFSNQQSLFDSLSSPSTNQNNSSIKTSNPIDNASQNSKNDSSKSIPLSQTNQFVQPILQPKNIENDSEQSIETDPVSLYY